MRVTDSASASATAALSLTINPPALVITTSSLPAGTVGVAYSQALGASGGTPPYTWSVASGSLPAGLSLAAGGTISGTPGTAGSSSFTVRVTDSASASTDGCAVADDQSAGLGDHDVVAAGRHGRRSRIRRRSALPADRRRTRGLSFRALFPVQ